PLPTQKPPIDTGDNRFANTIQVNGKIWVVQGIANSGRAAMRWARLNASTRTLEAEGVISSATLSLYFPSIAVNQFGDIVIGCTGSSSSQPASSYAIVGKQRGTSTTFGSPMLLRAGLDDYARVFNGENRWGDYSATTIDPSDPRHFWTIQEFVVADDIWATQ